MNELVQRLRALAASLEKNVRDLDNAAFVKKAAAFNKSLTTFEKVTAEAISGLAPGLSDLDKIFSGPDSKLLKEPEMKKLFQNVLGSKPPADAKAGAMRTKFLKDVKAQGLGEQALPAVTGVVNKARAAAVPLPRDKQARQDELLRLGKLDEESFVEEMDSRYKRDTALKSLARDNGMKLPKDVQRAWLIREIHKAAVRVAGHQIT
ncbi:hypothetical protein SAMN02745166_01790 [Prosthecobacter debontii]|uniref:Uncharacterized protein n=1 Tax=Prosthecobacter debontii TaxID=48467 RepID=A0A1T4XQJ2_9BACT|nr:hypothetical protein [Prosthecobacter debontii]SKA91807.1 hypothetical protein SAMN02745166_01790 [Prosthecobacter debontii]